MKEVVIVDAVRTPIGRYKGALKSVRPDDLGAAVIKALVDRNTNLDVNQIDEVIFGNANGAGEENRNVARMSALIADLPETVSGTTINRLCGSSLDSVSMAARSIITGEIDVAIAGGVESMSRAPFVMLKPEKEFPRGNMELVDTTIGWRFPHPKIENEYGIDSMPQTAENVAQRYSISREAQDEFAYQSQMRTKEAVEADRFKEQMIPITIMDRKGNETVVDRDEHPRPETTLEKLGQLRPIFKGGTVTAGNASGVNDGASALLVMSREKADALGLEPLVKYVFSSTAGVEPSVMGLGPINSTRKLLEKTGRSVEDIGLVELNEAFASQSLECINQLGLDQYIVNVNGGAISFGHPLGASGARILTDLIYEMKRRGTRTGLATMCIGVGQGISLMVDNIE
ncbi:thiolase family protein [Salinicoccus roseus]|uniref:Probable acetyl-CoA acyltransferase n=1 Tax=Salinicoccus roseus TaxID=45670 RepID=A0A0C2E4S5_9STAP|nr:acetyl-CoA C-acyltransferase [Salinicoccus roseus]KIH70322.1 beta-ketoadipyl CoA thiolase [Salinicoccus roseus]MDB0580863.1 acetyl-CoA C-acyltransferase [Salinicoccus roseus]